MRILFVCTGNTCRSSMAQALMEQLLRENNLLGKVEVRSAGVAADSGAPASRFAQEALREIGLDLSYHRGRQIDAAQVEWADLILTMTRRQREALIAAFPQAREKIHLLKEFLITPADREQWEQELYQLHRQMATKREAFAAEVHPNIGELRVRRAELLQELEEVEQLLAERQAELLERLRPERTRIDQIEQQRSLVDVTDPFGQPLEVYRMSRDELKDNLERLLQRLQQDKLLDA